MTKDTMKKIYLLGYEHDDSHAFVPQRAFSSKEKRDAVYHEKVCTGPAVDEYPRPRELHYWERNCVDSVPKTELELRKKVGEELFDLKFVHAKDGYERDYWYSSSLHRRSDLEIALGVNYGKMAEAFARVHGKYRFEQLDGPTQLCFPKFAVNWCVKHWKRMLAKRNALLPRPSLAEFGRGKDGKFRHINFNLSISRMDMEVEE
jgi:hypothetical protein